MKTSLLISFFLIFSISLLAQDQMDVPKTGDIMVNDGQFFSEDPVGLSFEGPVPGSTGRSLTDLIWVLDSVYYYQTSNNSWGREKTLTRNDFGNTLTSISHGKIDEDGIWENRDSTVIVYQNGEAIDEILTRPWVINYQEWGDTVHYEKFDVNGNLIQEMNRSVSTPIGEFGWGENFFYAYNDQQQLIERIEEKWDDNTQMWQKKSQKIYHYDENGYRTKIETNTWDSWLQQWLKYAQTFYEFDENGNEISSFSQLAGETPDSWVDYTRIDKTYDDDNRLIESLAQAYFPNTGSWSNLNNIFYSYDAQGNLVEEYRKSWDFVQETWKNFRLTTISYNEDNQEIAFLQQLWDNNVLMDWYNSLHRVTTYDENGNLFQKEFYSWNSTDGEWTETSRYNYFWSEFEVVDNFDPAPNTFSLYPNPASETITISGEQPLEKSSITIYNSIGRPVSSFHKLESGKIIIRDLQSGFYFLHVESVSGTFLFTFVKL